MGQGLDWVARQCSALAQSLGSQIAKPALAGRFFVGEARPGRIAQAMTAEVRP